MEPLITPGARLFIKITASAQHLYLGDIILFFRNHQAIVHRIIWVSSTNGVRRYLTKGDNNRVVDGWVSPNQILGRIEKIDTPLGSLVRTKCYLTLNRFLLIYSWISVGIPQVLNTNLPRKVFRFWAETLLR